MFKHMICFIFCLILVACGQRETLAPVVESKWHERALHKSQHRVASGETLYAIAFRYDIDYRQLAAWNHLQPPYLLAIGQRLRLLEGDVQKPMFTKRDQPIHYAPKPQGKWLWPTRGHKLLATFNPSQGRKGIDILGQSGDDIRASEHGVVAYAGNGLVGYGNLIIIKHDNQYLTAYGYNARNLVVEGQTVKKGQVIAYMGSVDKRFYAVHFEIRQAGRPVDPRRYT